MRAWFTLSVIDISNYSVYYEICKFVEDEEY
jgi:hypothetical protein